MNKDDLAEEIVDMVKLCLREEYESLVKTNESYNGIISEQRKALASRDDVINDMPNKLRIAKIDALADMFGGFGLGRNAWYIHTDAIRHECASCAGTRRVTAYLNDDEIEVECPTCKGYGATSTYESHPKCKEVTYVLYEHGQRRTDGASVRIVLGNLDRRFELTHLYETEEECQAAIDAKVDK